MLTSDAIAQDLPRLRRYARVLTGTQVAGDAYVSATLEALAEDAGALGAGTTVGLFRTFTRIWNSVAINRKAGDPADGSDLHLAHVAPLPRQAFLLMSLEDFPDHEAAFILGVDIGELRSLVEQFGRELAEEIATDVLIIEDEPLIALNLEELVKRLGHRVVGMAKTHAEALEVASSERPGLILADVRLQDGSSGLDAVNDLISKSEVPVVFITAYPERLLTGRRPEPAFLIPKPFREAHVAAVVTQALFFDRKAKAVRAS
ncbi:MAG TPA: response regulator [Candidatus Didemnitutus sp.]|nr:response regulator [Candidatus Didemnitutus sp.]HVZ15408.1 response regulator [Bauldia sp.]